MTTRPTSRIVARAFALTLFVVACGEGPAQPEPPPPDPVAESSDTSGGEATATTATVTTPTPALTPASVGLAGSFRRSESGGGIGLEHTWTFTGDRFEMVGYPSMGERGRVEILSRTGDVVRARFTERMYCGPCETRGPDTARDPEELDIRIAADGGSIEMEGRTYARVPPSP